MTFDEIENSFPDGALSDDVTGKTLVSAQWLHDFSRNIAAAEREACARVCDDAAERLYYGEACSEVAICARKIRERSNA